jgi:hypothetical protein
MGSLLFADTLKRISTGLERESPEADSQHGAGDEGPSLSTDEVAREELLKLVHYSHLIPPIRRKDLVAYEAHAEGVVEAFRSMLRQQSMISDLSRLFGDSIMRYADANRDDRDHERLNGLCSLMSMDAFGARKAPVAPLMVAGLVVASAALGFTVASAYLKARAAGDAIQTALSISPAESVAQLEDAFGLTAAGKSRDDTLLTDVLDAVYLRPDVRTSYVEVARVFTNGLGADAEAVRTLNRIMSDVPVPGDIERKGVAGAVAAVCGGLAAGIVVAMLVHHSHQQ